MNTFDHASERLDRYIWFMSHRVNKPVCGMEADDFHQTGLIKLFELCLDTRYNDKPVAEFDAIFKRCLFNAFMDAFSKGTEETTVMIQIDLQEISESWSYSAFDEECLSHYQQYLETLISADAAILLEYLLNPTPAVYHMHNIQRMRREALQRQGLSVRVPQKLTQTLVGQTIGFSASKTKALIREIRTAWTLNCQRSAWMSA